MLTRGIAYLAVAILAIGVVSAEKERDHGKDEKYTYKQVCVVDGKWTVLHGFDCRNQIAAAKWRNAVNSTGWTMFEVETRKEFPAEHQAYAAGYLEGILSKPVLKYHIQNAVEPYCKNFTGYCGRLKTFMTENHRWTINQVNVAARDDKYWNAVNRTMHQLTGMIDAYENQSPTPRVTYAIHPITMLNWNGDFYDLEKKLNKTRDVELDGKCSGLIKVAPGNKDLFISQVTMSGFQNMLRVLKMYKFAYDREFFPGYATSMASYPGMLYSSDDFALMSSGLAIIETTISVFNNSLFEHTKSEGQLPTWIRAIISNQLARDAREWCQIYALHNSGTYNNQWAVLDYSKFTPGQALPDSSLFYVLEQMPGTIVYRDLTWFLKKYSYFPSYNIPYFDKITEISGFPAHADKMGDWFRWGKSPRAKIFERDHHKVTDLDSLTKLMRYNNYKSDPFSKCNCTPPYSAEAGISARGDLNPKDGKYEFPGMGHVNHGGLDYKGVNAEMMKTLNFRAWGGPTWDEVPAFKWSTFDIDVPHFGHPDEWKFEFIDLKWETDVHA